MEKIYLYLKVLMLVLLVSLSSSTVLAKDKWISLQTKNFNVVSNADEKRTRQLTLKLEQFRYTLSQIYPDIPESEPVPVTVVIFKDDKSFTPFKPLYKGKARNISGYFQSGEDEHVIALDSTNENLRVIFHEYFHLLLSYSTVELPLWINEGLAEVYSSFEIDKTEVVLGSPLATHVDYLQSNDLRLIPLKTLIQVDHKSPIYNESDKTSFFYTQSWIFAHYLMISERGAHKPQLFKYIKLLRLGKAPEPAFMEAFGMSFEAMEQALRSYISGKYYPIVKYHLNTELTDKSFNVQSLSEGQAEIYLGNLLLRTDRLEEAEKHFKQSASLEPNLVGVSEGLAFIAMKQNNYAKAKEYFEQAVKQGSKNHLAYYQYAEAIYLAAAGKSNTGNISKEEAKQVVDNAQASIKLRPEFAQSYHLIGVANLFGGENFQEGIENAKKAVLLAPRKKEFLLTLGQLQVQSSDYVGAKKTLQPLLTGDEEDLKTKAKVIISEIDEHLAAPK